MASHSIINNMKIKLKQTERLSRATLWCLCRQHGKSSYPVDDFGLEGADDAAVVENGMLFIQFFEGCGCLAGEDQTHGYCRTVNCLELCVFLFNHVVVNQQLCMCRHTAAATELKNVPG